MRPNGSRRDWGWILGIVLMVVITAVFLYLMFRLQIMITR